MRQIMDATGQVTYGTRYDPYGLPVNSVGTASTMGFTGEQTDLSGLLYLRARYYDPMSGAFLSRDPVMGFMGRSGSYNGYSYVEGNPVNYADPSGRCIEDLCIGEALALAALVAEASVTAETAVAATTVVTAGVVLYESDPDIANEANAIINEGLTAVGNLFEEGFNTAEQLSGEAEAVAGEAEAIAEELEAATGEGLPEVQCHSFSADTDVATADGPVDISNIKIGDEVFAFNEKTGEIDLYPVTATFKHLDPEIVELTIDDETITTTPGHLFYTDEGWVAAGDLVVGDEIRSLDGDDGTVTAIKIVDAQHWMYDLTVDEAHTFFVGEGWLVHNLHCNNAGKMFDEAIQSNGVTKADVTGFDNSAN